MPFLNAVLNEVLDLPAGEVIKSGPHNVSVFERFEDGLVEGRFVQFEAPGIASMLDGGLSPVVAGISRRQLTGEIIAGGVDGTYKATGPDMSQVAEVINFGFATVTVVAGETPARYDQVYAVNASGADSGKATTVSELGVELPDVVFWEPKRANVWLVRIGKFL